MTIDEAIANEKEKAEEIRENIIDGENLEPYESYCNEMAGRLAEEHEQIAEWMEELKAYREIGTVEECKSFEKECYHKAIDSFQKWLKQQKIAGIDNVTNDILVPVNGIWEYAIDVFKEEMAEQLKVGVENEQSI